MEVCERRTLRISELPDASPLPAMVDRPLSKQQQVLASKWSYGLWTCRNAGPQAISEQLQYCRRLNNVAKHHTLLKRLLRWMERLVTHVLADMSEYLGVSRNIMCCLQHPCKFCQLPAIREPLTWATSPWIAWKCASKRASKPCGLTVGKQDVSVLSLQIQ